MRDQKLQRKFCKVGRKTFGIPELNSELLLENAVTQLLKLQLTELKVTIPIVANLKLSTVIQSKVIYHDVISQLTQWR